MISVICPLHWETRTQKCHHGVHVCNAPGRRYTKLRWDIANDTIREYSWCAGCLTFNCFTILIRNSHQTNSVGCILAQVWWFFLIYCLEILHNTIQVTVQCQNSCAIRESLYSSMIRPAPMLVEWDWLWWITGQTTRFHLTGKTWNSQAITG